MYFDDKSIIIKCSKYTMVFYATVYSVGTITAQTVIFFFAIYTYCFQKKHNNIIEEKSVNLFYDTTLMPSWCIFQTTFIKKR